MPGDNVDTDVLYPGPFLNIEDPGADARSTSSRASTRRCATASWSGTILVVGENFGSGSSREHVPQAMQGSGVRCVVGRSFARIFYRNCVNLGLAIVACPAAVDAAHDGSRIAIDTAGAVEVDGVASTRPRPPLVLEVGRGRRSRRLDGVADLRLERFRVGQMPVNWLAPFHDVLGDRQARGGRRRRGVADRR